MPVSLGAQLYTLRKELTGSVTLPAIFEFLKKAGCEVVELAALPPCVVPQRLAAISADTGVKICSTHSPFERIRDGLDSLADEHQVFDCSIIGIGSMPPEFNMGSPDDIKRFVDILNKTADALKSRGMSVMYHNHAFEFKKAGGKRVMDILLENTVPDVAFSLDVYWAHVGGASAEEYIDKMGSRLKVMHLKDYKPALFGLRHTMGAPGDGVLDFRTYMQKADARGVPYAVVEVDKTKDPRAAIERGIKFIKEIHKPQ